MIRKFLTAAVATAVIGMAALTAPTPALAYGHHGFGVGAGIAAGVIGGAIVGSAIANQPRTYVETPVYEDDYVTCHRVLFRDNFGREYYRRVCN